MNNITDVSTFTDPVQTVADGDAATGANFAVAVQGLANRARWLKNLIASYIGHFPGTSTNDTAGAGNVGEIGGPISRVSGSALTLTNNTGANVCTTSHFTLTPGDWRISALIYMSIASGTAGDKAIGFLSVSKTSATLYGNFAVPTGGEVCIADERALDQFGQAILSLSVSDIPVSIAAPTDFYLVTMATFNMGAAAVAAGSMWARRVR